VAGATDVPAQHLRPRNFTSLPKLPPPKKKPF
jgi:hypothetical protein